MEVGDFWSANFFLSGNLGGQDIFSLLNTLQDIFLSLLISLQDFFSSKKCRVYIYRMYLHLHCGYCSNSSNMELQSLKML